MGATRYSKEVKQKVLRMGMSGRTYPEIQKKFPIPKSTLSVWFKNAGKKPDRTRQLEHLKIARIAAAKAKRFIRQQWVDQASESGKTIAREVNVQNKAVAKALLAMLYWAEGAKYDGVYGLQFVNTDPHLMRLYLQLLRRSYKVDESRFRVRLHLYYYQSHRNAIAFWSKELGIPTSQFGKIYVKKRSERKRFRKNFQGICFVKCPDNFARVELLALGKALEPPSFNGQDATLRRL